MEQLAELEKQRAEQRRIRAGLMQALTDMRGQLEPDEAELLELTDSALRKLGRITDEQFAELELVPDFD